MIRSNHGYILWFGIYWYTTGMCKFCRWFYHHCLLQWDVDHMSPVRHTFPVLFHLSPVWHVFRRATPPTSVSWWVRGAGKSHLWKGVQTRHESPWYWYRLSINWNEYTAIWLSAVHLNGGKSVLSSSYLFYIHQYFSCILHFKS